MVAYQNKYNCMLNKWFRGLICLTLGLEGLHPLPFSLPPIPTSAQRPFPIFCEGFPSSYPPLYPTFQPIPPLFLLCLLHSMLQLHLTSPPPAPTMALHKVSSKCAHSCAYDPDCLVGSVLQIYKPPWMNIFGITIWHHKARISPLQTPLQLCLEG